MQISASIVVYNNPIEEIHALLVQLSNTVIETIFIIDNSQLASLSEVKKISTKIKYVFVNKNIGYGSAHNIAIKEALKNGNKYHIIINPDIQLGYETINVLYNYMEHNTDVGLVMPKILYNDGSIQKLVKLLPSPWDLVGRRFFKSASWVIKRNRDYELADFDYTYAINSASLSGCFMFLRSEILQKVGLFDERYFMYLEDFDLVRRIHRIAKTMYVPDVFVFHGFKKESFQNSTLRNHHVKSAIKYFFKWGWIYDNERKSFNKETNNQIKRENRELTSGGAETSESG